MNDKKTIKNLPIILIRIFFLFSPANPSQMDSSSARVPLSFILILVFIFSRINPSFSFVKICKPASCNPVFGPEVRFPFRLIDTHDRRCGYPGFDLSCDLQGQTILSLPKSGNFIVNRINYSTQSVYINDPGSCLTDRIFNFNVNGSSFRANPGDNYRFYNCSQGLSEYSNLGHAVPVVCFNGGGNYTVLAVPIRYSGNGSGTPASSCKLMPNVSVPLKLTYAQYLEETVVEEDLELVWDTPACWSCEQRGLYCGFKSDSGLDIDCTKPPTKGLSRGAKYGIIIGIGIPGLVCLAGFFCCLTNKIRRRRADHLNFDPSSSTAGMNPPPSTVTISGLDRPTIESYPKTVIGASRRLPEQCSDDGTCPICLCDYQPKDTLRSIPECNHYFHAACIDEWLKINGSCPLCRNSPEGSNSSMTPRSSMSSVFSTASSRA
ncbi:OLC1v1030021C1 [Oldenlandia corymbosa var. corymbosa]|uniref:RING-type E3 ubiquitin transferase n=1 Tax=Oldenlandia corymbosa var. corymbosa TaxID=529605 RepID=A0AAV1CF87_OLDCO|nr:OLC1v1030021C1 [Oldenlandia corymbosa var. corymbosa]